MDLKKRIEKVLSDILSDKYECKVTLRFEKAGDDDADVQDGRSCA